MTNKPLHPAVFTHFRVPHARPRWAGLCAWAGIMFATCLRTVATAQQATVTIEPDTFSTGEPATVILRLSFSNTDPAQLGWASFGDTLAPEIEVLERSRIDTVQSIGGYDITLQQVLKITCWDSGFKALPPFFFLVNGDTLSTGFSYLECRAPDVNLSEPIRDISDIYEEAFTWRDWLRRYGLWMGVALAAAVALVWWLRRFRKQPAAPKAITPQSAEPPDVRALRALRQLEAGATGQPGESKAYYAAVSDILRQYLQEQFQLPAPEETTPGIAILLAGSPVDETQAGTLLFILRQADMVKFARFKPDEYARRDVLTRAIRFVESTRPATKPQV